MQVYIRYIHIYIEYGNENNYLSINYIFFALS